MRLWARGFALAAILAVGIAPRAWSDPVEDFYRGRTVNVVIGYAAGGGFDLYARLLVRHMGSHIPGNPTLVPQNMPGAGSLKATNYLYSVAPRDGSVIGAIGRSIALAPLLNTSNADFDALRFNWIGSASKEILVAVSWKTSPVKTLEDAKHRELIVGSDSAASETTQIPLLLNATLGTRFKIITGYTIPQIALGMERGELAGQIGWSLDSLMTSHADWLQNRSINILTQTGLKPDERLPGVPLAIDHAQTEADRSLLRLIFSMQEIARPYVAPPGVPAARLEVLTDAFLATVRDPAYLRDAERSHLDIQPSSAEETTSLVRAAYATAPETIARAKEVLSVKE